MSSNAEEEECAFLHGFVWRKTYLTDHTYRPLVALTVISLISAVPTILLNSLVIFAVVTRRRLQTNCNTLLACLASTDLLTGLVVQPMSIAVQARRILGVGPFCAVEKMFIVCLSLVINASLYHLVLISIDRYIAIKHSLRYQDIVTKRWIIIGVFIAWFITLLATIQEIVFAFGNSETTNSVLAFQSAWHATSALIFLICVAIIIYTNCYIFFETRRQKKRIQTEQLPQEEVKRMKKDNKAAKTIAIVLATLIIGYLPTIIAGFFILVSSSEAADSKELDKGVHVVVIGCANGFVLLASLANPFIYCWRSKKLRRVFLEILHLRKPRNRVLPATGINEKQRHQPDIDFVPDKATVEVAIETYSIC